MLLPHSKTVKRRKGINLMGYYFIILDFTYVTLEHKTSHTGQFVEYASSERRINNLSSDVWFGQYLKIWNLRVQKNLHIEKIIFKVVLSNAYY